MNLLELARLRDGRTSRVSSYDVTGRNADVWTIPAGESRVLADIRGPGVITHIWMTQPNHYRECLIRITWDDAPQPSVLCPLGDFFGLGHGIVNSYQSLLFSASTGMNNQFNQGCALNCYVPMPFRRRALIELVNESEESHRQYFYVDYESVEADDLRQLGYFHAEFRRTNPFGGWGPEIRVNTPPVDVANKERIAWENNYLILETRGRGHYLGCNLSVTNFQGTWWGEGDDMIWVDGYKWPPDLHGTGSEDYLNQAWGMQPNAFLRNGSSIFEGHTASGVPGLSGGLSAIWESAKGGYQTSYVFHLENPVRFRREIKVTIEHGHGNHLANEMSSTAYWYAAEPAPIAAPPPVAQRLPVLRDQKGRWIHDPKRQCPGRPVTMTDEMRAMRVRAADEIQINKIGRLSPHHSKFITRWKVSSLLSASEVSSALCVRLKDKLQWKSLKVEARGNQRYFVDVHRIFGNRDGLAYLAARVKVARAGRWTLHLGHDGPARVFVDGQTVLTEPTRLNPASYTRSQAPVTLSKGTHEIVVAFDTDGGMGWGIFLSFETPEETRRPGVRASFPVEA